MDRMKYLIVVFLCLTLNSCEKEVECCSYNYWAVYNNPSQLNSECDCCYDLAGRKINCPL